MQIEFDQGLRLSKVTMVPVILVYNISLTRKVVEASMIDSSFGWQLSRQIESFRSPVCWGATRYPQRAKAKTYSSITQYWVQSSQPVGWPIQTYNGCLYGYTCPLLRFLRGFPYLHMVVIFPKGSYPNIQSTPQTVSYL